MTAMKMFGEKADYCQTIHALRILSEAMWHRYWDVFEVWAADRETEHWQSQVENVLKLLLEKDTAATQKKEMKKLPEPAPEVPDAMMGGVPLFGRRADGTHNGVSPDILLDQTYKMPRREVVWMALRSTLLPG
ncbi:hypothetical protein NHX12_001295 [Muraenolepis orangiensis]|uniref:Uncharacterized protein n=1 Tax=Muraenolepis orangiensis TaxID=630683 RepID=A0A9Q0IH46_9TELE|nr:hypothetical protein NHX12_001295 [Muraenolepis orangiensis]